MTENSDKKQCLIYIQGEVYKANVIKKDTSLYTAPLLICKIENLYTESPVLTDLGKGKYTGEKVAIFENGDKFQEYMQ